MAGKTKSHSTTPFPSRKGQKKPRQKRVKWSQFFADELEDYYDSVYDDYDYDHGYHDYTVLTQDAHEWVVKEEGVIIVFACALCGIKCIGKSVDMYLPKVYHHYMREADAALSCAEHCMKDIIE